MKTGEADKKKYSPQAQALLDKMKPIADEINYHKAKMQKYQFQGPYELFAHHRDSLPQYEKEFSKLSARYRRLRMKEEREKQNSAKNGGQ